MNIRTTITLLMSGLLAGASVIAADQAVPSLESRGGGLARQFQSPPDSVRPHTFWYWMNGNITREGITADLEAMKRAGIGGVYIFGINSYIVPGKMNTWTKDKTLNPEWKEFIRYAVREAGRLGLEVNLNNSPDNWSSSDGPWITPDLGIQRLTWSAITVEGGKACDAVLPQPPTQLNYYRDVAVLAFPTPALERKETAKPVIISSDPALDVQALSVTPEDGWVNGTFYYRSPAIKRPPVIELKTPALGEAAYIRFDYARPFVPHWFHLKLAGAGAPGRLESSGDGRQWQMVAEIRDGDMALDPRPARFWRVVFNKQAQVVKFSEIELSAACRLGDWTSKAMYNLANTDKPKFSTTEAPAEGIIHREQMLELSRQMDSAGRLKWEVPPGQWTIMRFGHTSTASGGLDCDKFNPAALDVHWKNALKPWFDDPEINPLIQYVHVDSYERGSQNWTPKLPELFAQSKGYELKWYLPTMAGRVVNSVHESERFLWDMRNTTINLMMENYFGHMAELCEKAGKKFTCEAYCLFSGAIFNNVSAGGNVHVPMTEFWMPYPTPTQQFKLGASPAHMYGHPIVAAEAFTAAQLPKYGGAWDTDFWMMKDVGDAAFAGGVNRMVFHVNVLQAYPGIGLTLTPFGTQFNRYNTWWGKLPGFTAYLARSQYLLQQGQFVGDLLYFSSENSPNQYPNMKGLLALPVGYDYDVCDPYVIFKRLSVKDGKLILPDGLTYQVLVLPDDPAMTPALARRIGELVEAGATIVAPKPVYCPSLAGQPRADQELVELADKIWGDCDGRVATRRAYGKGQIFWGKSVSDVLQICGIKPDLQTPATQPPVRYIHRRLKEGDFYFLASSSLQKQSMDVAFRVSAGEPQLWDALTGEIRLLPQYRREQRQTIIPLEFEPKQSYFVVFQNLECGGLTPLSVARLDAPQPANGRVKPLVVNPRDEPRPDKAVSSDRTPKRNFQEIKTVQELTGPWTVSFDPKWGGPAQVTFDKLEDWTKHSEIGIKYYSGKAVYRKTFDLPAASPGKKLYLDLGKIKNVAEIRLNGQSLGIIWCAPWRVEISGAVKPTGNALEIDVVNLWPNRMIGDEQLPADVEYKSDGGLKRFPEWFTKGEPRTSGRYTLTTYQPWKKDSPLLESGLMGPVQVMGEE